MTFPFVVGDLVVGEPKNGYGITNEESLCKVVKMYGSQDDPKMRVELLQHSDAYYSSSIGDVFSVRCYGFHLADSPDIDNICVPEDKDLELFMK